MSNPASAGRGQARRGSIRDLLQHSVLIQLPMDLRPFNFTWKFNRSNHERVTRRYAEQLREVGDAIIDWLDGETI